LKKVSVAPNARRHYAMTPRQPSLFMNRQFRRIFGFHCQMSCTVDPILGIADPILGIADQASWIADRALRIASPASSLAGRASRSTVFATN